MRLFLKIPLVIGLLILSMSYLSEKNRLDESKYEVVKNWPDLGKGYTLGQPTGVGIDKNDHVFVFHRAGRLWTSPFPDSLISANTVFELDGKTGKLINAWGANYFIMPHGLTVDKEGNVWVTDVGLHQIFKFTHDGKLLRKWGVARKPGNDSAHFNLPTDIAFADDGSFYVSDGYGNSRVVKFSASGNYIKSWGRLGRNAGEFIIPHGIAIDRSNTIYVADRQNNRIQLFDTSGRFLREIRNDAIVQQLPAVAVDKADRLFGVDYDPSLRADSTVKGSTFFECGPSGHITGRSGVTGTADRTRSWFHDLAIDSQGNIYVGDIVAMKLFKYRPR